MYFAATTKDEPGSEFDPDAIIQESDQDTDEVKPLFKRAKLTTLPPRVKGEELSSLCSIMWSSLKIIFLYCTTHAKKCLFLDVVVYGEYMHYRHTHIKRKEETRSQLVVK